jgi:hypothetical protein
MDNAAAPQPRVSRGGGHFSVPARAPEIVAAEAGAASVRFIPLQGRFNAAVPYVAPPPGRGSPLTLVRGSGP